MLTTITANGKTLDLSSPNVMGILNLTPDSFYAGSRKQTAEEIAARTEQIVAEGATIIDAGAMSTRPGGDFVTLEEEMRRMREGLAIVRNVAPDAWLSIDTFRPDVARMAVEEFGADIINDVSEGGRTGLEGVALSETWEQTMFQMMGRLQVPYILMSVQPDVETMTSSWIHEVSELRKLGVSQIILDPGYGFGKTLEGNYAVLKRQQELIDTFRLPLLAGVSRKRMIWQLLGSNADEALNGTTAVNMLALSQGASILRVHDVKAAAETIRIFNAYSL